MLFSFSILLEPVRSKTLKKGEEEREEESKVKDKERKDGGEEDVEKKGMKKKNKITVRSCCLCLLFHASIVQKTFSPHETH